MKILLVSILIFSSLPVVAQGGAREEFTVGKLELSIKTRQDCAKPSVDRRTLAKNLAQYDPSRDARSDIRDETPWSQKEIAETKEQLVEDGFVYPNGEESVITWMDFDDDGICDFTATTGIGGMRSTERMFLFRGMNKGRFKLVDSHSSFMDSAITIVPYVPVYIKGERFPLLIVPKDGRLLRWREDGTGFATCDANLSAGNPGYIKNADSMDFRKLCDSFWDIVENVESRLPRKNKVGSWYVK